MCEFNNEGCGGYFHTRGTDSTESFFLKTSNILGRSLLVIAREKKKEKVPPIKSTWGKNGDITSKQRFKTEESTVSAGVREPAASFQTEQACERSCRGLA